MVPGVLGFSNEQFKTHLKRSLSRNSSIHSFTSERSLSPIPGGENIRPKKAAALEASADALHAMKKCNDILSYNIQWDRRMWMEKNADKCKTTMYHLKVIYKTDKRSGKDHAHLDAICIKRNLIKKEMDMYRCEQIVLKHKFNISHLETIMMMICCYFQTVMSVKIVERTFYQILETVNINQRVKSFKIIK